ncbi:hypothetical protein PT974_09169 [Cladobotryum mycophilum]|uniref:Pentatricopeptide repeat protein n=1 Tax=Cladobotryum mycophilum TaxID=491253 RepID=A0ABR0SFH3_9HYPO
MSCRPIIRDLRCRNDIICRSCLSHLAKQPTQSWVAPFSSQVSSKPKTTLQARSDQRSIRRPTRTEISRYMQRMNNNQETEKQTGQDLDFSVRYFEQDDRRRTELPSEEAFGESFSRLDASELRDTLSDFKAGLRTEDEKDAFKAVLAEIGEGWDKMRTADDLEKMIARMQTYTESIDEEIKETGADLPQEILAELLGDMPELPLMEKAAGSGRRYIIPQIPQEPWTLNQRRKVSRLNTAMARAFSQSRQESGLSEASVREIYRAYHAARLALSRHWGSIPLDAWDFLWKAFATDESKNVHRLAHLSLLARDMSEAKVTLTPPQQLLTIEAVFVDGWEGKAIENWRRCISSLGAEASETYKDFWELGVRMYCRIGDLGQAERAINKLLDRHMSARILMPLIRTCCEQGTAESQEKAWTTYRRMRELLGKEMKLTDYDQVVSCFLTSNQVENGLFAFVDMMSDGQMDLKKQKRLPSVIANKFFFGKWLKRLIGAGDLDGAYSVVEFMQRKGIEGASIQVNGLIGAWLRSGGREDVEKADELAWRMIESRIKFVNDRKSTLTTRISSFKPSVAELPRATLETFYLVAENYRMRDLHGKLEALWDAFREAELKPDAFMMNQLLESHISKGQWKEALALYRSLVDELGVTPDPYSFSALWKTLDISRLHFIPDERMGEAAAATRAMFKEMVKFKDSLQSEEGMDGQLARKILHSFRRLKDHIGFLVTLLALRDLFKFLPPETLVMELVLGTTKLSWDTPSQRKRLMVAKRNMDHSLIAWAEGDAEKLEGDKRGVALYEYLQKKYWPDFDMKEKNTRDMLVEAMKQMGVYELLAPKKGFRR